jgi:predicted transposase YbfD/YdcC
MTATFPKLVSKHFELLTDARVNRGRNHSIVEMIFLTLCATISRADGWTDIERWGDLKIDWLRQFFAFENGIPSHDTLGRVFSKLSTAEFNAALISLTGDIASIVQGKTVAIDGKTLRGSHDTSTSKQALHMVSAYVTDMKLVIGLQSVDNKSNEIPAAQQLIDMLNLKGAVVTADAMHCQRETVEKIIGKRADYVLMVKDNQPSLHSSVKELVSIAMESDSSKRKGKRERNRGRDEFREVVIAAIPKSHPLRDQWKGIKTVGMVFRSRTMDGKMQEYSELFMSSLDSGVKDHAKRLRDHWAIENSQHYVLDVTFHEDASRIRTGNAPEVSAGFRRMALNILQRDKTIKDNMRGKRVRCGYDDSLLTQLLRNFPRD